VILFGEDVSHVSEGRVLKLPNYTINIKDEREIWEDDGI